MKSARILLCLLMLVCLLAGCAAQPNAEGSVSAQTPAGSEQLHCAINLLLLCAFLIL